MLLTHNILVDQLLVPALFAFFLVAGIAGTALGMGLILFRGGLFHILSPMNRWVSGNKALAPLEALHNIDPTVYKYRRWFSAAFIVGAALSMFMIVVKLDAGAVLSVFGGSRHSIITNWLVERLRWLMLAGDVLALAIGIVLGFFPNALGTLEKRTNRWYSPRQLGQRADDMHLTLDKWVQNSPRIAGWIISIGALIVIINSAMVLLGRY
jgi:hypothetical protein